MRKAWLLRSKIIHSMAIKRYVHFKDRKISQAQQFILVREKFPNTKFRYRNGKWHLQLKLQPTPFSAFYPIEVIKNDYNHYEVWLVGNIAKIEDPSFPHNYAIDREKKCVKLCLYHPHKYEWNELEPICNTIIPWTCDWLYYYELWLDDGIWRGGGEHPSSEGFV